MAKAQLPLAEVQATIIVTLAQFFGMMALGWLLGRAIGLSPAMASLLAIGVAFPNSGNFGIPLIQLAFGQEMVVHQAVVTILVVLLILIFAPIMLGGGGDSMGQRLLGAFKTPMIPAVALGLALNAGGIALPKMVDAPLGLMAAATTPIALTALGAQLAAGGATLSRGMVALGVLLKLVVAPLATYAALLVWGLPDRLIDLYVVGAAIPVGVLLAILAHEFGRHAASASALVAVTTVFSPVSVTLAVLLMRLT